LEQNILLQKPGKDPKLPQNLGPMSLLSSEREDFQKNSNIAFRKETY
jgi:hypothetical protein